MHRTSTNTARRSAIALLLTVLVAVQPLLGARPAHAAVTFTVNQTGDAADLSPFDNVCDANSAAGRQCTLRAAIQQANATADRDTIAFNISGPGVKTIRPASELPASTEPVLIDGYTQPGASRNTLTTGTNAVPRVELDGGSAGNVSGLRIEAPNTVVRGLVINRFDDNGIIVTDQGRGSRIEGCFVGTNPAGTVAFGNGQAGVRVFAGNATIGGSAPGTRNLISGNGFEGIAITSSGNRVEGNLIGTDKTGAGPLGNGDGVDLSGANNTVGGNDEATANTVAFNEGDGISVIGSDTVAVRILRNAIFGNAKEGIDLGGDNDGPTPNDPGDADAGPNNLQNKPILNSATTTGGTTTIKGRLNSSPNQIFVLRFFSTATGSEGKVFRGQLNVVTGAGGDAAFTFTAASAVPTGHAVTATATSETGDSSEFSTPRVVG